jgi:hypothetical protein
MRESVFDGGNFLTLMDHDITAAETAVVYEGEGLGLGAGCNYLGLLAQFTYVASAATSVKAWVQTSFDGGVTYFDIMNFAFTTSTLNKWAAVSTNIVCAAPATPTDATLADNTMNNGLLGDRVRIKLTTVGTYGAGTNLTITGFSKRS